ncbi:MAG: class I SAM-dependent methyltransferase [Chitinophagaceae bacterium]|nr:class I SAM-dependent methyltransferase [Chitinophagaceae bacterium]MBL0271771.1 class I SAM-dependent methyltransferase [Chitinophagaceae bacterium]
MANLTKEIKTKHRLIPSYEGSDNIDPQTVSSFGEEWNSFHGFSEKDIQALGEQYFDIVSPGMLNETSQIIDIGCGSGRFIKYIQVNYPFQTITGIDPSSAILAADALIGGDPKVNLIQVAADSIPFPDEHFDFGYSLGVLHHIPDTTKALNDCVKKIKKDGHFLLYLYYNLDNKPYYFKIIFYLSNLIRLVVSKMPAALKKGFCAFLAIILYMPFVLLCRFLKFVGVPKRIRQNIPLQVYENQSFYIIRNDSLDRFGTPLEQRFSRKQIQAMMEQAGLSHIVFSERTPYWHAIGQKQ